MKTRKLYMRPRRLTTYHATMHLRSRLVSILNKHVGDEGKILSPAGLVVDLRKVLK